MYDSYARAHVHAHTDHASNVMQMSLSKAFSPIDGVNPDYHFLLVELVRELEEVPV